ncbi:unnamed protein product [Microthlaspi erraticum]|uniref:Uncharacterized protein n=1 Tax=Microthlaspi erraticum TaxID=1685480 RepID=A0A6D2ID33_9BRAS|nr:unnamed protein product [Microthlaspi erraticum]
MKKKDSIHATTKKQIKLGSSSSNARAAIPTHHIPLMQSRTCGESKEGEDDWALVSFVGEQIQDPRKYKKAMEKEARLEQALQDRVQRVLNYKEFLSTVALAFPNNNGDQPAGDGLLLFKIGDANGRISISALCQLFGLPNETAHDFKENSKGNKLPLLIGHTLPMNHSCLQDQRCLESLIQPFAMCTASSPPLSMQTRSQQGHN